MAVADKVKSIIVEQLGVDEEEVTPDASFVDDLGADSLDTVELVMAFEEEFGIEIPDEDAEKITRVKEAVEYIDSSGIASLPSTETSIFAVWRVSRSSDTSLIAGWAQVSPRILVASIASGATRICLAAWIRSYRRSRRHSFMRKPTVPRFMPNTGFTSPPSSIWCSVWSM